MEGKEWELPIYKDKEAQGWASKRDQGIAQLHGLPVFNGTRAPPYYLPTRKACTMGRSIQIKNQTSKNLLKMSRGATRDEHL
jgi:hypothetical protein